MYMLRNCYVTIRSTPECSFVVTRKFQFFLRKQLFLVQLIYFEFLFSTLLDTLFAASSDSDFELELPFFFSGSHVGVSYRTKTW